MSSRKTTRGQARGGDSGAAGPSAVAAQAQAPTLPDIDALRRRERQARQPAGHPGLPTQSNTQLIQRVASNSASPVEVDMFNSKLDQDRRFNQEALIFERTYREAGKLVQADRLRSLLARMLLQNRSRLHEHHVHPSPPAQQQRKKQERDTSRLPTAQTEDSDSADAAEAEAEGEESTAVHTALMEMIERVISGTASNAHKKLFTYQLLASEELFERVSWMQSQFELGESKAQRDKAKRLGRLLKDCTETLLTMHEDAAPAYERDTGGGGVGTLASSSPQIGISSGGGPLGSSPSQSSSALAGGNLLLRGSARERAASASRDPMKLGGSARVDPSSESRGTFHNQLRTPSDQTEPRYRAGLDNAGETLQRLLETATIDEQQQQGRRGSGERSGQNLEARSRAAQSPRNPKKAGKRKSKKK
ncbi:hypothetical protein GJ744_001414 [Endocarpon pusillum]|uniref:Uncharacterized protein n=1 Tax=Endocarpon pusillum TaxID=364733 RepID=A0A8H7AS03_9EURO|nr:hypothetical protein GJ744_001414 [Endocarpon pusillum]